MTGSTEASVQQALRLSIASHYSEPARQVWRNLMATGKLPWVELVELASRHGLGPLLYASYAGDPAGELPPGIDEKLKSQYQLTATLNMLAIHDLEQIVQRLNDSGIRAILLKGAALLSDVYDNLALRPMVDVDILISYPDLPLALESLSAIGYENPEPAPFANVDGLYWNEVLLRDSSRTSAQLEVHWNLLDNPYYARKLKVASLMRRASPIEVGSQPALMLAPEDLLLHLCAHNLYHHRGMLRRTEVDIAFVAHRFRQKIDWEKLLDTARASDMVLGLKQSLVRSVESWQAPIPLKALEMLDHLSPKLRESFWATCQRSEFLKLFRTLITLPTASHRWRFVQGQLLPSREYLFWRYGTPPTSPALFAYARRYLSGASGLMAEISRRPRG